MAIGKNSTQLFWANAREFHSTKHQLFLWTSYSIHTRKKNTKAFLLPRIPWKTMGSPVLSRRAIPFSTNNVFNAAASNSTVGSAEETLHTEWLTTITTTKWLWNTHGKILCFLCVNTVSLYISEKKNSEIYRFCCTPPFETSPIKAHRFCVLPPLKHHPSNLIGFVYFPLWNITHQSPSVLCTPPPLKNQFFCRRLFWVGVYFGKYVMYGDCLQRKGKAM